MEDFGFAIIILCSISITFYINKIKNILNQKKGVEDE